MSLGTGTISEGIQCRDAGAMVGLVAAFCTALRKALWLSLEPRGVPRLSVVHTRVRPIGSAKFFRFEPQAFVLRDGFLSFRQFVDRPRSLARSYGLRPSVQDALTAFDREIPYRYFVFDVFRWLDLRQLLGSAEARGFVVNPIDGDWKQMSESAAKKLLVPAIRLACETHPETTMPHFQGE